MTFYQAIIYHDEDRFVSSEIFDEPEAALDHGEQIVDKMKPDSYTVTANTLIYDKDEN